MSQSPSALLRPIGLALCLMLALALIIVRTSAQNPAAPAATSTEKPVEEVHKNIQVLKGLPESQLIPVMNYINSSLGVRCNFCHVNKDGTWDYASDEKGAKKSAREMITMVTGINKNSFKGNPEVSCYTCHRGNSSVAHTLSVPVPTPEPRPQPGPNSAGQPREALPTIEQVLDKYTQALGGTAAIEKLKSRVMKGSVTTAAGATFPYELYQSGPDKGLAVITGEQGTTERGFNSTGAWEKGARGVREMGPAEAYYLRRYPDLLRDIKLKDEFSRIAVAGKDKINGRDVYVVRANTTDNRRERLFFDVETGLLVRRASSVTTPVGTIPEQVDFEDYREVEGMKLPFTIRVSAVDPFYSITRKFTEIKLNVPIDEKKFNKPG
ncbi:MAG TPA: c-type cytochrome [Pyrinomonadaceae bacterium]|nr:c-type cytochrome [Pyrinomonadaceae bacterium]